MASTERSGTLWHLKGLEELQIDPHAPRTLQAALVLLLHVAALASFPALVQGESTFGPTYEHQTYDLLRYFSGRLIKPKADTLNKSEEQDFVLDLAFFALEKGKKVCINQV